MKYPLTMTFKILAFAPQIYVRDADGVDLMYVKQKLFKLKEDIRIYTNESQTEQIYTIKADRIIDFSPRFNFVNRQEMGLGAIKRQGMRSLWRASYDILSGESAQFQIREENAFVKIMDGLFGEIPILGIFSGYFFNPSYAVKYPGDTGATVMRFIKHRSFFESNFVIEKTSYDLSESEEELILLSILTATLMERRRG